MSGSIKLMGAALAAGFAVLAAISPARSAGELNALVWCDHTDPALIQPFEEKHGVKVNLKEYEGTGAALAIALLHAGALAQSAAALEVDRPRAAAGRRVDHSSRPAKSDGSSSRSRYIMNNR